MPQKINKEINEALTKMMIRALWILLIVIGTELIMGCGGINKETNLNCLIVFISWFFIYDRVFTDIIFELIKDRGKKRAEKRKSL